MVASAPMAPVDAKGFAEMNAMAGLRGQRATQGVIAAFTYAPAPADMSFASHCSLGARSVAQLHFELTRAGLGGGLK
jgi:hypothetical protein